VKDPSYLPARYVTELALRDTVNTMPPATLQAATTATVPGPRDSAGQRDPEAVAGALTALGVDLAQVAQQLEDNAVRLFQDSYAQLVDTVTAALNAAGADVRTDGPPAPPAAVSDPQHPPTTADPPDATPPTYLQEPP